MLNPTPGQDPAPALRPLPAGGVGRGTYRPDIDGLRAVAVMAVVLFHYGFSVLPGGFVGVDVFFVISGFLITAITREEFEGQRFSLQAFYERRIRRIVPAFATMLFACGVASFFVFLPEDMRLLAKSTAAATVFGANLLFARIANDYFDADNLTLQPLLHTWSLAVEAQFYLVYPLLLLPMRRRPALLMPVLLVLAIASFAFGAWGVRHQPSATFYLLPGRAWELLLGGLLALILASPWGRPVRAWPAMAAAAVPAGLVTILLPAALYGAATPFPGLAALPPCFGALLVILGGSVPGGRMSRWLGAPPLAALGRSSYSLYLWHWPVLVLVRYGRGPDMSLGTRLLLLLGTVLVSFASWYWVERPFITRRLMPRRRRFLAGAGLAGAAGLCLGGVLDLTGRGVLPLVRLPPEVLTLADGHFDRIEGECPIPQDGAVPLYPCRFGADGALPSVVLWGNSYARMWVPSLDRDARRRGAAGVALIYSKCPPLAGLDIPDLPGCAPYNDAALAYIAAHPSVKSVVLGADWFDYGDDLGKLAESVSALQRSGVAVTVLLAPPQSDYSVPRTLAMAALRHAPPPPPLLERDARAAQQTSTDAIERLHDRLGFGIVDPATALCDGVQCALTWNGHPLFYDAGHITVYAASHIAGLFDAVFQPTGGAAEPVASPTVTLTPR